MEDGRKPMETAEAVSSFMEELAVAMVNARIFGSAHRRTKVSLENCREILKKELADLPGETLEIRTTRDFLVHGDRPLLGLSLAADRFLQPLGDKGLGGFNIRTSASPEDLSLFLDVLVHSPPGKVEAEKVNTFLEQNGCTTVEFLPFEDLAEGKKNSEFHLLFPSIHRAARFTRDVSKLLETLTLRVCQGGELRLGEVEDKVEEILKELKTNPVWLLRMSEYERYDAFTFGHSLRVCLLALHFTRALTDDQPFLSRLGRAALLHDIGKSRVPFEILHCRGRLTEEQQEEMKRHPVYGAEILLESRESDPLAVAVAFGHHKRLDYKGYPSTLHKAPLSLATKIVKICDVFEALTSVRPYKHPIPPARAYRIMMSMEGHFDPKLLKRFIQVTGVYPLGTQVLLSTGEKAVVIRQNENLLRPVVSLLPSSQHGDEPAPEERILDLSRKWDISIQTSLKTPAKEALLA